MPSTGAPLWVVAVCLAFVVAVAPPCAAAATLSVQVDRIDTGFAIARDVAVDVDWDETDGSGRLVLRARRVDADSIGYAYRDLIWSCTLLRLESGRLECVGPARAAAGPVLEDPGGARLGLGLATGDVQAELSRDGSTLRVGTSAAAPDAVVVLASRMPAIWLQSLSTVLWEEGRLNAGQLDGRVVVETGTPGRLVVRGDLQARDLGFDTPDGLLAGEGVGAALTLEVRNADDRLDVAVSGALQGGELLAGHLYVPLPGSPVDIDLVTNREAGRWAFQRIEWRDGDALDLSAGLVLGPDLAPESGQVRLQSTDAGTLGERYLSGLLAPAGLSQLRLAGALQVDADHRDGHLSSVALHLDGVNIIDGGGRFSFAGLRGHPRWTAGDEHIESRMSWSAAALYGLGLGAAELPLESRGGELGLSQGVGMALLGGRLHFDHFVLRPPGAGQGARIALGMSLSALDLGALSQRLGWPPFTGTVEGRIPLAVYANNRLSLDGGLTMQLFDGTLSIGALSMERPFGVAPTLSADIDFDGVEMQPLTAAFGIGEIVGQMAGRVHGLRLLDWSPVAFDAHLYSDPDYRGRRRISQRAVRDISSVGGNFIVTGLQSQALRLFSSFAYRQFGIRCQLADQVCVMDGIGSHGGGYTIIEGWGLPRLTVVGYRRFVDWPVLVERMRAVSEGQMPVID